jgi:hypothetical protein
MNLPQMVRWATGIRWQWKVFIPIVGVLAFSLVVILALLRSLEIAEVQSISVAGSGCAVLMERPLEELMQTIARVCRGDLTARVGFAKRSDSFSVVGRTDGRTGSRDPQPASWDRGGSGRHGQGAAAEQPESSCDGRCTERGVAYPSHPEHLLSYARPRPLSFHLRIST